MIILTHFFNCIIIIRDANISINNNYPNNYHFMQIVGLNPQTKNTKILIRGRVQEAKSCFCALSSGLNYISALT